MIKTISSFAIILFITIAINTVTSNQGTMIMLMVIRVVDMVMVMERTIMIALTIIEQMINTDNIVLMIITVISIIKKYRCY
jgi:hypothetical protein